MRIWVFLAVVLCVGAAPARAADCPVHVDGAVTFVPKSPPVPAPPISFSEMAATAGAPPSTRTLSAFQGEPVVVALWGTWCPPCIREIPSLDRLQDRLPELRVLALAWEKTGGLPQVQEFLARYQVKRLKARLDPAGAAAQALGARQLPTSVLVDRQGEVRGTLVGSANWDDPALEQLVRDCLDLPQEPQQAPQETDVSRDAVTGLEAYAAYKMGDYDTARRIWEGLAAKGNTTAMINLANLFQQGQGVSEDQRRALGYVRRAAELGDSRAQYELGMAYEAGALVPRDIAQAAHWLQKSAENGDADGQFAYGVMLVTAQGRGHRNASAAQLAEGLQWLRRAKDNGNLEAGAYIKVLERP